MPPVVKRWFLTLFLVSFMTFLVTRLKNEPYVPETDKLMKSLDDRPRVYNPGTWRGLTSAQAYKLSKLGRILYLDDEYPAASERKYTILIWKHGPYLERRHIRRFSDKRYDPFEGCSVNNCRITYEDGDLAVADMVIFHLHATKGLSDLPGRPPGNSKQIWTFLSDESPYYTFLYKNQLQDYNGLFNWSMAYRMDTDVPVPYGRTVLLKADEEGEEVDFFEWNKSKKQDVLVAILISNCGGKNRRWDYVKELQKHITVDVYGGCGNLKCPGHFGNDCRNISDYKFYLAFENANCDEYVTEKLWWNGFGKRTVPIVMGPPRRNYELLLPPRSFIHVDDFAAPRDLATYVRYLNETPSEMQQYFTWRKYFKALNEHGYYGSPSWHYCRACEALNYNSGAEKVYTDLKKFWSVNECHPSWDEDSP